MALECTPPMIAGIYFHGHRDVHMQPGINYTPSSRDWARHMLGSFFLGAVDHHSVASADNYLRLLGMGDKTIQDYRKILDTHVIGHIHDLALGGNGLTLQRGDEFYLGVRINGESLPWSEEIESVRDDFIEDLKQGALQRLATVPRISRADGSTVRPIL